MSPEEAAALLQSWKTAPAVAPPTNAAPQVAAAPAWTPAQMDAPQAPQESMAQYWSRSPLVQNAPGYIREGAEVVGDAMTFPRRAAIAAPMMAGRYVAESPAGQAVGRGARFVAGEAARNLSTGWNAVTAPVRYAGRELNRTIVQPLAEVGEAVAGDINAGIDAAAGAAGNIAGRTYRGINRGVEAVERGAGAGAGRAASWVRANVIPPPIATPMTRAEYDALPRGTYYVDPETRKTYRKQ